MSARRGLLFSDGSILVLPEGMDIDTARTEAEEHDRGDPAPYTRIVDLDIAIFQVLCTLRFCGIGFY